MRSDVAFHTAANPQAPSNVCNIKNMQLPQLATLLQICQLTTQELASSGKDSKDIRQGQQQFRPYLTAGTYGRHMLECLSHAHQHVHQSALSAC